MSGILTLVLTPDNPCNTVITDSDSGKVIYNVATQHDGKQSVTTVKNAEGRILASWEWRDVRSDILTLGDMKSVPMSTWLKKTIVPFKDTVTFEVGSGKTYKWKGNSAGLSFELYIEDDKKQPIARFKKSYNKVDRSVTPNTTEAIPAVLALDSRGQEIQDFAVISFLALEKSRRMTEASTMNRADAMGTPIFSSGN